MTYENGPRRPLPRADIDRGNSTAWGVGAAIVAAVIIVGGMMLMSAYHLVLTDEMVGAIRHLGYPDYFRIELGVAKGVGALALLIPGILMAAKRFAYAGFTIALVSAIIAHTAVGDPAAPSLKAGILLVILIQMLIVVLVFAFVILAGRNAVNIIPSRDYVHIADGVRRVYGPTH